MPIPVYSQNPSFCGHLKLSISDYFTARKPIKSIQVDFNRQKNSEQSTVICGGTIDGRKVFAFDQTTADILTVRRAEGKET